MKSYIGTKRINAKPMTRAEYNISRGWTLPADEDGADAGYLVEYVGGGKANVPGHAGYVSWSPKDVFERAYQPIRSVTRSRICGVTCRSGEPTCNGYCTNGRLPAPATYEVDQLDFGQAITAMKAGKRVTRAGWNGPGLWLEYIPAHGVDLAFIRMSYPVGSKAYPAGARVPWLASQTDVLAEDWEILQCAA